MKYILSIINTVCLILLLLLTAVQIPAFTYSFYDYEYKKNNTYDEIGISKTDMKAVTEKLIGYMKGSEEDLNIEVKIHGETREFFNEKEKLHMVDVMNLFSIGYVVRNIIFILFMVTLLGGFLLKQKDFLMAYLKTLRNGIIGFNALVIGLLVIIFSDFNKYFTMFHEIFFSNDLWLLDPATDLLINIVPLNFFIDIFSLVGILYFAFSVIVVLISVFFIYAQKAKLAR